MAYLLAIETATKVCSIALFKDHNLVAIREENLDYSHAENIAVFADAVLNEGKIRYADLDAVAISKGPGSYTGLRIGVAFAKGLCFSLSIPLISLETLKAMAWGAMNRMEGETRNDKVYFCPMIDARRKEVYTAVFDSALKQVEPTTAKILEDGLFEKWMDNHYFVIFGDGAEKSLSILKHENLHYLKDFFPSALNMGSLAYEKFQTNECENLAYFEPFYLKEFIALKGKKLV